MIEILNYERANRGKVIGYADIMLPPMQMPKTILRRIAHLQSGDRRWFNLASFGRTKGEAEEYVKYWQFELEAHNGQLLEALHEKVREYCVINKIPDIESLTFSCDNFNPKDELPF